MHKIYLLLRDNKQTGPFNLEELLRLSLRPLDLIWVDGRSTGWQYPGEIEVLKPFVTGNPQKQSAKTSKSPGSDQTTSQAAPPTVSAGKKSEVPLSAKHIFVSFPAYLTNEPQAKSKPEESEEDKLERKAEEIKARVQAFSEGKKEPEENAGLQAGYSRSLEDIKTEYTSWVYQQHQKKKGWVKNKKGLLIAAMVLIFSLAGYFSGRQLLNTLSKVPHTLTLYLTPRQKLATSQSEKEAQNGKEKETAVILKNSNISTLPPPLLAETGNSNENRDESLVVFPQKTTLKKIPAAGYHISPGAGVHHKTRKPVSNTTEKPAETATAKPEQPSVNPDPVSPPVLSVTTSIPLPKLIEVSADNLPDIEQNGSAEHQLTVQNNSDQLVNVVAVDVYYYKDKKLLGKKVIYFDNIPPKSSLTLPLPKQKKANTTNYQIGLISSKSGVYYLR